MWTETGFVNWRQCWAHIKSSSVSSGESETISVSLLDDWSNRRFFRSILGESWRDSCELLRGFSDLNRFHEQRNKILFYFLSYQSYRLPLLSMRWGVSSSDSEELSRYLIVGRFATGNCDRRLNFVSFFSDMFSWLRTSCGSAKMD